MDSIIFPKVLSLQTPAGLEYQILLLFWVRLEVKWNNTQAAQNKNISFYKPGSVSAINLSCSM